MRNLDTKPQFLCSDQSHAWETGTICEVGSEASPVMTLTISKFATTQILPLRTDVFAAGFNPVQFSLVASQMPLPMAISPCRGG
jgi:hypothetical protein